MKIGYLVPEFPGQTHAFFWREVMAMEAAGADITLLSTRRPASNACPHAFRETATARTQYLFPPALGDLANSMTAPGRFFRATRYLSSLSETSPARRLGFVAGLTPAAARLAGIAQSEGLEHIHIHSCATAAHLGPLSKIFGGPGYSLTLHGDLPVYGTDHAAKMSGAAFVSTVTRPLAEDVAALVPEVPTPVITMGVDTNVFTPADRKRKAGDPLQIAVVARLNRTKGHRHLLTAIAKLTEAGFDIRCRIAGDGPERAAIEAAIHELAIGNRVEMLGSLGQDEVRDLLQRSDALALTSFGQGEAAPVTVMEAMSTGLPVIVSRIGGTPDMIENGANGILVPQKDETAIADAIARLARNPELAAEIGQRARMTALAKFDYRNTAKALLTEIERQVPAS